MNLLKNGGFEAVWNGNRRCHVFPSDEVTSFDNILVPNMWTAWYMHEPGTWDKPEVHEVRKTLSAAHVHSGDPIRVHGGEKAILLFTFCRRHLAGFYQQVYAEPGAELRLSAWAHAWSNHGIEGYDNCKNDPRCSIGVGREPYFCLQGEAPLLNGDPWNDGVQNFLFSVGIDPTGDVNPFTESVVWGRGAHIYNRHAEVPAAEVTVPAGPGLVTVFLRTTTLWALENNNAYWDDIRLEGIDMRGRPRIQYERTYVLLPPGADRLWAHAVVEATWDDRHTLGGSADDAGIGDLDVRKIIAVNPAEWGDLAAFYREHYPDVEFEAVAAASPDDLFTKLAARK